MSVFDTVVHILIGIENKAKVKKLCFLEIIMNMLQLPGKTSMTGFNLNVFTNIFISTSQMEQMFTIGPPIVNMATFIKMLLKKITSYFKCDHRG